jgi:hypothetical protein
MFDQGGITSVELIVQFPAWSWKLSKGVGILMMSEVAEL